MLQADGAPRPSGVSPWSAKDSAALQKRFGSPHVYAHTVQQQRLASSLAPVGSHIHRVHLPFLTRSPLFHVANQVCDTSNGSFARLAALRSLHGSAFAADAAKRSSQVRAAAVQSAAASAKRSFSIFVLAPTFLATHVALAWTLVPPIYLVLRETSIANTLLAGPQGAWLLSRKVPHWVPDSLVSSLVGGQPELNAADDAAKASDKKVYRKQGDITVEELLERLARRGIRILWNTGSETLSFLGITHAMGRDNEDTLARDAVRQIGGEPGQTEQSWTGGLRKRVSDYSTKQVRSAAEDIKLGQVRDAVAAWVIVKLLFPVRLPIAALATPRVARFLARSFAR